MQILSVLPVPLLSRVLHTLQLLYGCRKHTWPPSRLATFVLASSHDACIMLPTPAEALART